MGDSWQSTHNDTGPSRDREKPRPRRMCAGSNHTSHETKGCPRVLTHNLYSVFVSRESSVQLVEGVCPRRMDGVRIGNHGLETVFGDLHDFVQGHADLSQVRTLNATPTVSKKLIG